MTRGYAKLSNANAAQLYQYHKNHSGSLVISGKIPGICEEGLW